MLRFITCGWLVLALAAFAAAQPPKAEPKLAPEQVEKLKTREPLREKANALQKEGKFTEAAIVIQQILKLENEILGEKHPDSLGSLGSLAGIQEQADDFPAAKKTWQRLFDLRSQALGKDHWQTTDARLAIVHAESMTQFSNEQRHIIFQAEKWASDALVLDQKGKYREAEQLHQKALVSGRKLLAVEHPHTATYYNNVAINLDSQRKYAEAEPLHRKALAIRRKVLGEEHPDTATSYSNVASNLNDQKKYTEADPLEMKALTIRRKVFGEEHPDTADSYNNVAYNLDAQAKSAEAEPLHRKTLALRRKVLGEEHPDTATSYSNLAVNLDTQAKYAEAESLHRKALALRRKVHGEEHPHTADSYNNLAHSIEAQGKFAEAEPLHQKALAIRRKVLGEEHARTADSYNNLALNLDDQGKSTEAEPLFWKALTIRSKVLGKEHPQTANSYNSIAHNLEARGRSVVAEPFYRKALAIRCKALGEEHPHTANSYNNVAHNLDAQAKSAEAEPFHHKALAIYKKVLGEEHLYTANSYNGVAANLKAQGKAAEAEPFLRKAVAIITAHLEKSSSYQSESDQLANAKSTQLYLENLLAGTREADASTTYDFLFKLRGAITARQYFARSARTTEPEVKKILGELQLLSQQISHWMNNPPKGPDVDIAKTLDKLTAEFEQKQKELSRQSNTFRKYEENKKLTPADLQKKLPADAVLIDFLMFGDELTAFVISPKEIHRVDLGKLKPIADAVDAFIRTNDRGHPLTGKPDDPALVLLDKLLTPLRKHTGDAKLWLVSPDGPLCRLPFAALPGKDESKYLIEEVGVAVIPVPRLLFDLLEEKPTNSPASLVTIGGVAFDSNPVHKDDPKPEIRARAIGEGTWKALEGTKGEATAIAGLFVAKSKNTPTTLEGELATKAAVRAAMEKHAVFHFASHGFFADPKYTPKRTANPGLSPDRIPAGPNPNLLCGLVCAGANKPTADSDGILNALEVMDLDLTKVELAVLSACETGLGEFAGGEGVLGLQRAFQLAGARTTVTSLWKVSDRATEALMVRFYRNRWEKGMGTLEALTEAQRWMLTEGVKAGLTRGLNPPEDPKGEGRTPPRYWAAFMLSGDWR